MAAFSLVGVNKRAPGSGSRGTRRISYPLNQDSAGHVHGYERVQGEWQSALFNLLVLHFPGESRSSSLDVVR